ncbi:MAG: radical SAM protein [Planctomycetales bacterium]|nr:radical SAM protein [Planctomycetales bacterium]
MTGSLSKKDRKSLRLQGVLENRPILGPHTVHFDITNACNVRCTTCWHHSPFLAASEVPSADWKRRAMPFDRFAATMDDLLELGGLEQVILSGMGDPSLHVHIHDMVEYAHQRQVGVTIISNLLSLDLGRLLASSGQLELLASICGVTPRTWAAFHGGANDNGWERLLSQLAVLHRHEFAAKHVQVINTQNYFELPDMVRFAKAWGAKRVNFKFASLGRGTEAVALTDTQKQELLDRWIPSAKAVAHFSSVATDLPAFETQIQPGSLATAPIEEVGCHMGTVYARITVQGEVLYCCNTDVSVGFLDKQQSFRDVWLGSDYVAMRERLGRGEFFASCHQCGKYKQNLKWAEKIKSHNQRTRTTAS